MGNKNGFDPSITRGLQICHEKGERLVVVHPGGFLAKIDQGAIVLFETKAVDGERLYWFGRTTSNAYWLILKTPVCIFDVLTWLGNERDMILAHDGELDFVDMDKQREFPF